MKNNTTNILSILALCASLYTYYIVKTTSFVYVEAQYQELKVQHEELVEKLSTILPNGAYISKPEKEEASFNVNDFMQKVQDANK